jgi:predicted transcriptional regulator
LGKYRTRIEIVAEMLRTASEGARKTHIMYQCNLSYKLLQQYLEHAVQADLLSSRSDGQYVTTDRGRLFLDRMASYLDRAERLTQEADAVDREKRLVEDMLKRRD